MEQVEFLILGAGPTGLGAAIRLCELGRTDYLVLERADRPGGLAASYTDAAGFTWDVGGHVQFSHYAYFDQLMERALGSQGWLTHQRESWAWMGGRFIPYPVQQNLRHLPHAELWRCLAGLLERSGRTASANFRDWLLATFGAGLAQLFMLPYNFKVWAHPLELLSFDWIGERVAVVDLPGLLQGVLRQTDEPAWGANRTFRFPRQGGTGAIWSQVAALAGAERIRLNTEVVALDLARRRVRLGDGQEIGYAHLLSTLPLDKLTTLAGPGLPAKVVERARQLRHSTVHVVGLGLQGQPPPALACRSWIYFPEDDCPFYRVTVFSNYSPSNVPDPACTWSLLCETSSSPFKAVPREGILESTIQGCLNTGLLQDRCGLISTWSYTAHYGYPTPSLERDAILAEVVPVLESLGVSSRGRFGGWKYEVSNQDHSLMQGVEFVNRVCLQEPEVTYRPGPAPGV